MRVGLNSYHFSEYATWDVSIIFPWTDLILKMTDFSNPLHPFRPYYYWPSTSKPHQLIHPKVRIISSFFSHMCVLSKRGVFQEILRYWKLYEQFWAETCSLYWERKLNGKCILPKIQMLAKTWYLVFRLVGRYGILFVNTFTANFLYRAMNCFPSSLLR